ncbi:MAG TPA: TIM barrel protein [Tepidisphaeraceae bacterium]|nr:TIM barrel protein [Tepidisphaeraceae bacterium]
MKFAGVGVVAGVLSDDPRQAAQRAQAGKFGGLQFDLKMGQLDLTELSETGRREFRRMLADSAQKLIALRADAGADGLTVGADVDRVLWRFQKSLAAAAALTAPMVCLDLGRLPAPASIVDKRPPITPEQAGIIILPKAIQMQTSPAATAPPDAKFVAQVDEVLAMLGAWADQYGVTVAMRSSLSPFSALKRALDRAACPWLAVDFDPVDALQDGRDLDAIFSDLGGAIRHVRGRDAMVGDRQRVRPAQIGRGAVGWPSITARLEEAGFNGWITVDSLELPQRQSAALNGAKYLAPILTA